MCLWTLSDSSFGFANVSLNMFWTLTLDDSFRNRNSIQFFQITIPFHEWIMPRVSSNCARLWDLQLWSTVEEVHQTFVPRPKMRLVWLLQNGDIPAILRICRYAKQYYCTSKVDGLPFLRSCCRFSLRTHRILCSQYCQGMKQCSGQNHRTPQMAWTGSCGSSDQSPSSALVPRVAQICGASHSWAVTVCRAVCRSMSYYVRVIATIVSL